MADFIQITDSVVKKYKDMGDGTFAEVVVVNNLPTGGGGGTPSNLATVATSGSYTDLTNKPTIPSLTGYATEQFVNEGLAEKLDTSGFNFTIANINEAIVGKQATLVSGNNIKTINGQPVLGSGDITISGGGGGSADLTQVTSDIIPTTDITQDIGSPTLRFNDAYFGNNLNAKAVSTAETVIQPQEVVFGTVTNIVVTPDSNVPVSYQGQGPLSTDLNIYRIYFGGNYAQVYTNMGVNFPVATTRVFAPGTTVRITLNDKWWDILVTAQLAQSSGSAFNYTPQNTNTQWPDPAQYNSNFFATDGGAAISATILMPSTTEVVLDGAPVESSTISALTINGATTTTPVPVTVSKTAAQLDINYGAVNSTNNTFTLWAMYMFNISTTIDNMFAIGNTITISDGFSNTAVGVVIGRNWTSVGEASSSGIITMNWTTPPSMSFNMGTWYGGSGTVSYSGLDFIKYKTLYDKSTVTSPTSFTGLTSDLATFFNTGDELGYMAATGTVTFTNSAGTNVKTITYDNITGDISYDGIVQSLIIDDAKDTIYTRNVSNETITNTESGRIAIGKNAVVSQQYGVALGTDARTSAGVAVGQGADARYNSVGIGPQSYAEQYGVAVGSSARVGSSSSGGIAIGMHAKVGDQCMGVSAFGGTGNSQTRNQNNIVNWAGSLNNAGTGSIYLTTNMMYYGASQSRDINQHGIYLPGLVGYNNFLCYMDVTYLMLTPNWGGTYSYRVVKGVATLRPDGTGSGWILSPETQNTVTSGGAGTYDTYQPALEVVGDRLYSKVTRSTADQCFISCKIEMVSATFESF